MDGSPFPPRSVAAKSSSARVSRRDLLRCGIVGAGSVALASALAACEGVPPTATGFDWRRWWDRQRATGVLDFANWPYYIDRRRDNSHPSLDRFTRRTGINVQYLRPIRDNETFFQKIKPMLDEGAPIGYDLIVLTNGPQLTRLMTGEHLTPLDHRRLPSFRRHASDFVKDPAYDPGNQYTVAWQSGITGIAYRPEAVSALGRQLHAISDLWSRELRGRVGMLRDTLDLGSFGLLVDGIDPRTSSTTDWEQAAINLTDQQRRGIVRGYYDQGYIRALQRGEIWASQAWSGDIFQSRLSGYPELRFVVPDEGGMLWTDNLMIPRGAAHPLDALTYMDFVYRPTVAAMIAAWVQYITPVPEARRIIAERYGDETVADSPLVFPTEAPRAREVTDRFRTYPIFATPDEEQTWNRLFNALI